MSSFLTDMWSPSSQQCHEELCLIFVQLIIYIASVLMAPSSHTSTHQHTCSPCAQTFVPKGKKENKRQGLILIMQLYAEWTQNLLAEAFGSAYHLCLSVLQLIEEIFNEDPVDQSLVNSSDLKRNKKCLCLNKFCKLI